MKTYKGNSLAEIYKSLYNDMLNAKEISPRGMKTKEIICPQILLTDPRSRLAYNKNRKFSLKYALVESLLLFDNTNELKYFSACNKNIHNFSDDGEHLYGSYGYRIAEYIPEIIEKLKFDNNSRQIVLPILRIEDVVKDTKDVPCTLNLQLIIRDGKLNMITNMRSNDIIWGLPYDIYTFTTLQEVIANTLKIELGWYMHRPTSLHLYERHYDLFKEVANDFTPVKIWNLYTYNEWIAVKNDYKNKVNGITDGIFFNMVYEMTRNAYDYIGDKLV